MKCRINRTESGEISSVLTESGERSIVFDKLKPRVGEALALNITALTETEDFKNIQNLKKSSILKNNFDIFIKSIKAKKSQRLGYYEYSKGDSTYYFKNLGKNTIGDGLIETPIEKRGKGSAKNLLTSFIKEAGSKNLSVFVTVSPRDGSTTEKGLKTFYKSLGFVQNGTDFEMIRRPLKSDKNLDVVKNTPLVEKPTQPTVEEAVKFATKQENVLSIGDQTQINNSLLSLGLSSYGQLLNEMEALLQDGLFIFTESNLTKSRLYNKFEINNILNSIEAQNEIRRIYQALKNSDNVTIDSINSSYIVKTANINILGKQEVLNPYQVEKEITKIIAGKDLNVSLDDIPYNSIKNLYRTNETFRSELNRIASENRNIQAKKIEGDELVDVTTNKNRTLFEKTIDLDASQTLTPIVDGLASISSTVWNTSLDSVYTLLKDFNIKAINGGVDFLNLEDKAFTKSQDEILTILESFIDVLNSPTENNLDYFFDVYSDFFGIEETPVQETALTQDDKNVYLESDASEISLFNEFGLLKESENVYKQIDKIENVDEAYSILLENSDMFPENIKTVEDLKNYISEFVNQYNTDVFETNISDLENLIIHKLYFGTQINFPYIQDSQAEIKASNFEGDINYLTTQYVSDFYKDSIKEKNKNSQKYKDFYSNFTIGEKGIILLNDDPITISKIEPYIDNNLAMYNMLSKNLNLPLNTTEIAQDKDEMQYRREYVINNPSSVKKLKGEYSVISSNTVAIKNETENFVKTPAGVYEYVYQIGDVALYTKLPQGNEFYNEFGKYLKPESNVDVTAYSNLEIIPLSFVEAKNYYTKAELEEINKNFNC